MWSSRVARSFVSTMKPAKDTVSATHLVESGLSGVYLETFAFVVDQTYLEACECQECGQIRSVRGCRLSIDSQLKTECKAEILSLANTHSLVSGESSRRRPLCGCVGRVGCHCVFLQLLCRPAPAIL